MKCTICTQTIEPDPITGWAEGHSAAPITDGRCCTPCNTELVLPTRLGQLRANWMRQMVARWDARDAAEADHSNRNTATGRK